MPSSILATNTTAASSSDVIVAAGAFLTVGLKDADGDQVDHTVKVYVELKDDAGQYNKVDTLTGVRPALVLSAGTWRFSRPAGASCGVFSG